MNIVITRECGNPCANARRKKNEYSLLPVRTLLAVGLLMLVSCRCRICRSEYQSLLVATACCKGAKALDRRKTPDSILMPGVKFKNQQSKLGQFHHHEIDWQNLLLELEEFKKSQ